ncbi:MAG: hypothetical protein ACW99J_19045 [Candidatus Thorarchaeota archaeon]|jgi:hypothetical protein
MNYIQVPSPNNEIIVLLRAILEKQHEQNMLLKTMLQRQNDMHQQASKWKAENPELSNRCQAATKKAAILMNGILEDLVDDLEILDTRWHDKYMLSEFIDKYGPKLQHFSILVQTLAQLG